MIAHETVQAVFLAMAERMLSRTSRRHRIGATNSVLTVQAPGLYGAGIIRRPSFRWQPFRRQLFAMVAREWVKRADHAKRRRGKIFVGDITKKAIKTKCAHQPCNTMIMYDKVVYAYNQLVYSARWSPVVVVWSRPAAKYACSHRADRKSIV